MKNEGKRRQDVGNAATLRSNRGQDEDESDSIRRSETSGDNLVQRAPTSLEAGRTGTSRLPSETLKLGETVPDTLTPPSLPAGGAAGVAAAGRAAAAVAADVIVVGYHRRG